MSKEFAAITGLGIGEETKGAAVEWFSKKLHAHTVTRSGGCQGGAFVVREDGREQMFSHFGAGTFDGVRTHLMNMVVNPVDLFEEGLELESKGVTSPFSLITIDENCLTVTPYHSAFSRLKEILRGDNKHGTVGIGVGEAIRDSKNPELSIRAGEFLGSKERLKEKIEAIRQHEIDQARDLIMTLGTSQLPDGARGEIDLLYNRSLVETTADSFKALASIVSIVGREYFDELIGRDGAIVNESSHGALLHPRYGFVPHVTQIDPTSRETISMLKAGGYDGKIMRFGVSRCYMTRHGAGPLVSFNPSLTKSIHEVHNGRPEDTPWLGEFRTGNYDLVAMKYALDICGGPKAFDGLMISYLDQLKRFSEWQVCVAYDFDGSKDGLSDFFKVKDGLITGIKIRSDDGSDDYLVRQAQMTELLKHCHPVLATLKPQNGKPLDEIFINFVEENLGVPVVATAYGPKMSDRKARSGYGSLFQPAV
jgi:adenylosuccinate synthase